jgi:hypothetical protein
MAMKMEQKAEYLIMNFLYKTNNIKADTYHFIAKFFTRLLSGLIFISLLISFNKF